MHDGGGGFAFEGGSTRHQVIHGCAEGVDVGAEIDVDFAADLFGGDVVGGSVGFAGFGFGGSGVFGGSCQAEVGEFGDAVAGEDDVFWFDVAVDEAALVGVGEGVGHLDADV